MCEAFLAKIDQGDQSRTPIEILNLTKNFGVTSSDVVYSALRLLGGDSWTAAAELHRRLAYEPGDVTL
jgi:hypothetical protein